jgi:hypothetical protein
MTQFQPILTTSNACIALMVSLCLSVCGTHARQDTEVSVANAVKHQITEGRVKSTISFLASDELAGRATASNEFNIAAAYVASRFRGAGLTGGANGDYYHETNVKLIRVPEGPIVATHSNGIIINHFGLFAAGAEPMTHDGPLASIDLSAEIPNSGVPPVVVGRYALNPNGDRQSSQLTRMASRLSAAGAKALLIAVSPESDMIRIAQQARDNPRFDSPQNRPTIPILLVPEEMMNSDSIKLQLPAFTELNRTMRNVIGLLPGSDPELAKEAVLFSAHLDHLGSRPLPGDGIFNGADDDASGVTGVVTLADAYSAVSKPKRSLLFMTFWGEESGLLGSKQFVEAPSWPLDKIIANVNIEMIGRPEPGANGKIWMTGWHASNLGSLMADQARPMGIEIFEHPSFSARLYRASDNWSFVSKGVIAHSFSAGSLHSDYHGVDDEWERLEIPHMTRVIQGLFHGTQGLANGAVTPTKAK